PAPASSKPAVQTRKVPCPGLEVTTDKRIDTYLRRTGASGGGGRNPVTIAKEKFSKLFSKLKPHQKKEILAEQRLTQKWKNDHQNACVFSSSCKKTVVIAVDRTTPPPPCSECVEVHRSTPFKKAISKPIPKKENRKFVNKQYLNEVLGKQYAESKGLQDLVEDENATQSLPVRFALGCLSGKYSNKTLEGLVKAYVTMEDRKSKGKGLQNFKYTPEFLQFCHDQHTTSPAAYRGLGQVFQAPAQRTLEKHIAKEPRFPVGISTRNFELVQKHLNDIAYDGPVGLGCDDTKLFSGLQLMWDGEKNSHFLVGGCDEPIQVLDADAVQREMSNPSNRAATKLRLWVLSIPYPKIPPVIVAAKAIPDNLDGQTLSEMSLRVIRGLIGVGAKVVSYSSDGSEVERSAEKIMIAKADSTITYEIPSPCPEEGLPDTKFTIPVFDKQAVAMGQDSKHALKTFRNNLFSGARLLTLGNYVVVYQRIREIAYEEGSPLYQRDVDKVDRQDDSAATRLFSADVLEYITKNHPDYLGEAIYLFIFGDLIDAFQNRFITHHERLKMVLRARHFINHWEMYLKVSGYPKATHIISKEALDISRILIDGYARKIVKDFNFRDFIYMMPKLLNRIR
ncbi:hypothetical protein DFP72DRAFT_778941, partial [Ephemerocybe angulata]